MRLENQGQLIVDVVRVAATATVTLILATATILAVSAVISLIKGRKRNRS